MTTFDTPSMRALRERLRRRPNVGMLKVWNGNEGPTLEQLVAAAPPEGGMEAAFPMEEKKR
jgi:hypothetical protein